MLPDAIPSGPAMPRAEHTFLIMKLDHPGEELNQAQYELALRLACRQQRVGFMSACWGTGLLDVQIAVPRARSWSDDDEERFRAFLTYVFAVQGNAA